MNVSPLPAQLGEVESSRSGEIREGASCRSQKVRSESPLPQCRLNGSTATSQAAPGEVTRHVSCFASLTVTERVHCAFIVQWCSRRKFRMSRPFSRFMIVASLSAAALLTIATDASAGHRHRRAKGGNAACCGATVSAPACSSAMPVSSGCCGGSSYAPSHSMGYPYSGATTVSNRNASVYGQSMYYPSNSYSNSGYQGGVYNSPGYNNGAYNNGYNNNSGYNNSISAGANTGAAVGQAIGGNTGANVGAAIGAAAGAR